MDTTRSTSPSFQHAATVASATGHAMGTSTYQALPLPTTGPVTRQPAPMYPASYDGVPAPVALSWSLKPFGSAETGIDQLSDGRDRYWIRHETVKGVTPAMLAWWFTLLEGDVVVQGRRVNRYRLWHPYDHVHASYARRLPDGSIGPGAVIRLREVLGGNPRFKVDIATVIEKIDEEGFIHNPVFHGIAGLARMEYTFKAVPGGTLYENCLIFGSRHRLLRLAKPWLSAIGFPPGKGRAWLRHNIEEVGMFEHFLPGLYAAEAGVR